MVFQVNFSDGVPMAEATLFSHLVPSVRRLALAVADEEDKPALRALLTQFALDQHAAGALLSIDGVLTIPLEGAAQILPPAAQPVATHQPPEDVHELDAKKPRLGESLALLPNKSHEVPLPSCYPFFFQNFVATLSSHLVLLLPVHVCLFCLSSHFLRATSFALAVHLLFLFYYNSLPPFFRLLLPCFCYFLFFIVSYSPLATSFALHFHFLFLLFSSFVFLIARSQLRLR
jgi:hypothetical protein